VKRILVPLVLLVLAWLAYRQGVLTSTVPGPAAGRPAGEASSLSARLEHAGDLVLQGTGDAMARPADPPRDASIPADR